MAGGPSLEIPMMEANPTNAWPLPAARIPRARRAASKKRPPPSTACLEGGSLSYPPGSHVVGQGCRPADELHLESHQLATPDLPSKACIACRVRMALRDLPKRAGRKRLTNTAPRHPPSRPPSTECGASGPRVRVEDGMQEFFGK